MKAVKLWGGLGNQMFQYAFAKYLEREFSEKVYFYIVDNKYSKEDIDLLKCNVDVQFIKNNDISNYTILSGQGMQYRIERKILKKAPFLNNNIYIESSLAYTPSINKESILYDGYWQSYKYLASIKNILLSDFTLKDNFIPHLPIKKNIETSNSVSIHIRRGDYLTKGPNSIYSYCDEKYYSRAITRINKRVTNPVFYIFSNELDWVKSNLKILNKFDVVYVNNSKQLNANLLDMYLMTFCKHNIIANSTFSWWGAWLNQNIDKCIIAPIQWYNKDSMNETTFDLVPPEWIRI